MNRVTKLGKIAIVTTIISLVSGFLNPFIPVVVVSTWFAIALVIWMNRMSKENGL